MKTGRPKKYPERLLGNGIMPSLWDWLEEEAKRREMSRTALVRQVLMEFQTETCRGTTTPTPDGYRVYFVED